MEIIEVSSDLEDPEVAGTEPASAWTGAKKPKIQSTPTTPGDLGSTARGDTERSSGEIVHGQEQVQDEIEGWDDAKLSKKPKIQSTPTTHGDLDSTARDDTERSSGEIVHGQEQEQDEIEGWDDAKLSKKPKIQSTPTSPGDLDSTARDDTERSSGEIVHGQEQERDEIEGWDDAKLSKEIDGLRKWMHQTSYDEDYASAHDDELWVEFNEEQQTSLNQRLALCRIKAHEKHYQALGEAKLLELFPPEVLERNFYYERYESRFDWFFDPEYCKLARVEDYQRLVLRVTVEFEGLEICPYNHHTLEDDQQFVQFWEMLSRRTELIEKYIKAKSSERPRIKNMLLYHALKIAEKLPSVYKTPIVARFREFVMGLEADYTFAGFLTKMWELLAKKKMNFTDALRCVYNEDKYWFIFQWGTEFESNLPPIERIYKPHLDRIVEKCPYGDVHQLVMDTIVENFWKPRRYYDYVRKKMRIAEEISLIDKQPPHRLYTPGHYI